MSRSKYPSVHVLSQSIYNFARQIYYFEPNSGSDIWPTPLMPTTAPLGNAQDNLPSLVKKYDLIFRIGSRGISVRAKMFWDDIVDNVNAAFRYIEATDHIVERLLVNDNEVDILIEKLGKFIDQKESKHYIWTALNIQAK